MFIVMAVNDFDEEYFALGDTAETAIQSLRAIIGDCGIAESKLRMFEVSREASVTHRVLDSNMNLEILVHFPEKVMKV